MYIYNNNHHHHHHYYNYNNNYNNNTSTNTNTNIDNNNNQTTLQKLPNPALTLDDIITTAAIIYLVPTNYSFNPRKTLQ